MQHKSLKYKSIIVFLNNRFSITVAHKFGFDEDIGLNIIKLQRLLIGTLTTILDISH